MAISWIEICNDYQVSEDGNWFISLYEKLDKTNKVNYVLYRKNDAISGYQRFTEARSLDEIKKLVEVWETK